MTRQIVDNLFHAGVSQSPITPPIGFTIAGPEFVDRPAFGIDDDLYARCVVFKSYGETVALGSLDVWAISNRLEKQIRCAVADATDIPQRNIIILATGNGTSPPLWRDLCIDAQEEIEEEGDDASRFGTDHPAPLDSRQRENDHNFANVSPARELSDLPKQYRNYIGYLPDIIAGTALEAKLALEPAAIGTVSTTLPNLSTFTKPNQPENLEVEREILQLTVIQTADNHIACLLYGFACPATIVGNTRSWSADYPGVASSALENAGIDNAIFIQGASADVQPFDWWDGNSNISHADRSSADAQAFGILLATQAIRSAPNAVTRRNAQIKAAASENGDIKALRIGDTTLISVNQPHLIKFVADLRSALPETKLLVSTNPAVTEPVAGDQRSDTIAQTIELVNQSGIYP